MKIIKKLSKQLIDEVEGSEEYAKDALEYKGIDPELSRMYAELSKVEYGHVQRLHDAVTRKIKQAAANAQGTLKMAQMMWKAKH